MRSPSIFTIAAAVVGQPYSLMGHFNPLAVGLSHCGSRKTSITVFYKTDPIPIS